MMQMFTQGIVAQGSKFRDRCLTNIDDNYRYYDIKLILELLSGTQGFHERYTYVKESPMMLMFMAGSLIPELLCDTEAVPKSYRRFLTRMFTYKRDPDELMNTDLGFCQQVHEKSGCSHELSHCMYTNLTIFVRNCKSLGKLYGKIYLIPLIMGLWSRHSLKHCATSYITNVTRSTLSLSSFYLFLHTYLTMVDRTEKPKKIHYHFSLVLGSLCLILGEKKTRSASICQFMIALYINMFFEKSTQKYKLFWKVLFPLLTLLSLKSRGIGKTLMTMV